MRVSSSLPLPPRNHREDTRANRTDGGMKGDGTQARNTSWCEEEDHRLYEYCAKFNQWLDAPDRQSQREHYGIHRLAHPSKGFLAGSPAASIDQTLRLTLGEIQSGAGRSNPRSATTANRTRCA